MALTLVTGPPGAGKSWYCVRRIFLALTSGQYVATNIKLHDGWARTFARQNYIDRFLDWASRSSSRVDHKARLYERRVFVSGDLAELFAVRLPDCGKCRGCRRGHTCQKEARGIVVLDEAHEWLNSRTWDVDDTGKKVKREDAVQARLAVVKFFALHRKLGWDVFLISQNAGRIDNQVRDNFEFHTHLKNMRKFKIWGLIPVVPFNWFWAVTFWHSGAERVGVHTYLLNKLADCYDTMARPEVTFGNGDERVIRLPLSLDEIRARAEGRWRPPWHGQDPQGQGAEAGAEATLVVPPRPAPTGEPAPVTRPPIPLPGEGSVAAS